MPVITFPPPSVTYTTAGIDLFIVFWFFLHCQSVRERGFQIGPALLFVGSFWITGILIAARPLIVYPANFFCLLIDISTCLYVFNTISKWYKWPASFINTAFAMVFFLEVLAIIALTACVAFGVSF